MSEHDEEFRSLLIPSREVPRFDPLTDAAEPQVEAHAVPHFEPLEGAGTVPGLDGRERRRRRKSGRKRQGSASEKVREKAPVKAPVTAPATADRRQTLILVAVILLLVVAGVLYTATQGDDAPQGASRSLAQLLAVRV